MTTSEQNNPDPKRKGQERRTTSGQVRERLAFSIALVALWSLGLLFVLTQ